MSTPIETLKKIEFSTIEQFLEDINRNFAVVENSPLYKGIPGNPGGPGGPGLSGVRGVKFLFVKLSNFQTQFPGELSAGSQIDLNYINTKLIDFDNKQKLLLALEITEFVDKDIIVLTNTIMLSFDYIDNIFINTGIAFNEQSNLLNNIQTQIENYVQYYISHNQTINNLTNIFEGYITYAKNYADTNNVFITSSLTQSSVFSPFIPGYNSNIGILMNNHKYFGFSDEQFPKNNNGTIVFGAMKKYYDLLMSTISTDQNQTLTSDYAPGVDNIPAAVFLQDTEKAGLLIGYKGRPNLKRFANIYKNDLHELILKSDSGVNPSEFSLLKIHKDYLKFDKLVQFGNDLEVSRDTKLFSDIYNGFIKTGKFTTGASSLNGFNQDIIEIGKPGFNTQNRQSIVKNVADIETYKYYLNNVLITNSNGQVSKSYSLETTLLSNTNITDLNLISESINSGNKILTSYYFGYLARKINAVSTFVTNNYWKKNQFNTGVIPHLWIGGNLRIGENISLSDDMIITNTEDRIIYFDVLETYLKSQIINFENFKNKVLITDNTGNLLSNYSLETNILNPAELVTGQQLTIFNELDTNILSTKYYAHLAKKINNIDSIVSNGVWNKTQYNTFEIPNLYLSNDLIVKGNVIFKPNNLEVFKVNATTNEVTIGNSITATNLNSNIIKLQNYINKVLITGSNGEILNTWIVEPANHNNSELSENILLSDNIGTSQTTIAKGSHIKFINKKINQVILWVTNKFWSRLQFASGIIPSLWLSDWLRVDNKFTAGNINNPNIYSEGNNTNLGKTGGDTIIKGQNIKIENKPNNVLVTDANSNILDQYSIETLLPNSGPGTGGQADNEIVADFWIKPLPTDILPWQPFLNIAFSPFKFLTSIHFEHLIKHIKAIRTLLYDRPTFDEMQDMIDKGMPIGGIILYDLILGPVPDNFVVCDGRIIPGTNLYTRNYIDKFVKGSLTPAIIGGNVGNMQTLQLNNMVPHVHTIAPHTHPVNAFKGGGPYGFRGSSDKPMGDTLQTAPNSSGLVTDAAPVGGGQPFSIEPYSITAIVIMKFWNGIGTKPVTTLPPFAQITSLNIINTELNVSVGVNVIDTTTTALNVEGTFDNGVTWNTLKIVTGGIISPITNVILPNNGDWIFRLKATNGNSSYTTGEYSDENSYQIYIPWAKINSVTNLGLNTTINFTRLDSSVTTMKAQASLDGINYTDYYVGNVIGTKAMFTLPSYNTWYFRIQATNGIVLTTLNTTDDYSEILTKVITATPPNFANIDFIEGILVGTNTNLTFTLSILDITTTLVKIEYLNSSSVWTQFIASTSLVDGMNFVKAGASYMTRKYRLKALNGTMINTYSNEIFPNT